MRFLQNRAIAAMLVIVLALTIVQFGGYNTPSVAHAASNSQQQNQHPNCYPCYSFYGSIDSWMSGSMEQEAKDNWCGIATVRAIQRYDWMYYGNNGGSSTTPGWDNSQQDIYNRAATSGESPWGRGSGPGASNLMSNISGDYGTDPHAIAYVAWYETPVSTDSQPYYFHNWIYKTSAITATYDFATDFGVNTVSHNDPISVTVDGGYHSFVVSGVYASSDPSEGGTSISAVKTWDPWLNSANQPPNGYGAYYNQTQEEVWSISDWTSLSKLWGQGYTTNGGQDPEPDTAGYPYYNPPFPGGYTHHWVTYYVTIEQDAIPEDYTPVDNAIGEDGHLAPHN